MNTTSTKSSVDSLIRSGAKQSDHIVLCVDSDISLADLSDALNNRVRRTSIKDITVIIDGKDKTYSFDEISKAGFKIRQEDLK